MKTKINIYARSFRKYNRAIKSKAKYPMYYTDLILDFEKKKSLIEIFVRFYKIISYIVGSIIIEMDQNTYHWILKYNA